MFNLRFLRDESRAISGRPRPVEFTLWAWWGTVVRLRPAPFSDPKAEPADN